RSGLESARRGFMKKILLLFLAASLLGAHCMAADASAKGGPRFRTRVICFNGKLDSGSSCSGTSGQPDTILNATNKMTCGFPGQVSEIEWSFMERHKDKDVYRFTRRFPADSPGTSTASKSVEFSDKRL